MRVLFLTHSYPRHVGDAAGSFLLRLAQALTEDGITVRVIAPSAEGLLDEETIGGIPVTRFRYAPRAHETLAYSGTMAESVANGWGARLAMISFLGAGFGALMREQRTFHPDVVHAHWWFPNGLIAAWATTLTNTPLVTTSHGTDLRMLENMSALKPVARYVLNRSACVTTVSQWLAQQGRALMKTGLPIVAPMPAAVERFYPASVRTPGRLLFVGRLNPQKGIEYAIRALAVMRAPAHLDVIGGGPDARTYQRLAETLGVVDRISFLGGVAQHDLPSFYQNAAALVVPSINEGLGLVAVEAQLCETPVVAFASGGMTDIIDHGETGLLVPPRDVAALAAALDELLQNPALASNLGRAGRTSALRTFAPASVAQRYASVYQEAIQRRAA